MLSLKTFDHRWQAFRNAQVRLDHKETISLKTYSDIHNKRTSHQMFDFVILIQNKANIFTVHNKINGLHAKV
jgi:hypothetical protein